MVVGICNIFEVTLNRVYAVSAWMNAMDGCSALNNQQFAASDIDH